MSEEQQRKADDRKAVLEQLNKNGTAERVEKVQEAIQKPLFQRSLVSNFRRNAESRIDEIEQRAIEILKGTRGIDLEGVMVNARLDPSGSLVHLRAVASPDAIAKARKAAGITTAKG